MFDYTISIATNRPYAKVQVQSLFPTPPHNYNLPRVCFQTPKARRLKPGATQSKPAYAGSPILIFRSPRRRTKVGVAAPFRVMATLKTRPRLTYLVQATKLLSCQE